jgi:hypothetical protein
MKRGIFSVLLMSVIGLFLFFIHTHAEAENWKRFFEEENGIHYYDKESIHYPHSTKGFLGLIKTDKNIVRVWIKFVWKTKEEDWIILEELRCSQREIQPIESHINRVKSYEIGYLQRIVPGSWADKLHSEVCK